jgi:hypothetical protein
MKHAIRSRPSVCLVALLAAAFVAPVLVRGQSGRPQVLIVGTYHMANPGRDLANINADDVLAPKRQAELATLANLLAAFRPTKIALEYEPRRDSAVNARFAGYLTGTVTLGRGESEQVGMRLAKQLGHTRVYGVDHQMPLDLNGLFQFAAQNGHGAYVAEVQQEVQRIMARAQQQMKTLTIPELIVEHNQPSADSLQRAFYLRAAQLSAGDAYAGPDMTTAWYSRNLRIHANIARLITSPDERVLVLIGAGHTAFLRDFIRGAGAWTLVDPLLYLQP